MAQRPTSSNRDIEWLWDTLYKPFGIVRWFARNADSSEIAGDFADSARALVAAASAYKHLSFYVQPNPTAQRTKLRSSAKDVSHWSYLFVDIDPMTHSANPVLALAWAMGTLGRWKGMEMEPLVIDSGRGMQAWIRLDDAQFDEVTTRHGARAAANLVLHRLDDALIREGEMRSQPTKGLHGCRVDVSCSDLPRLMRCPGTINHKTGRPTYMMEAGKVHVGLGAWLYNDVPVDEREPRVVPERPGLKWQLVKSRLTFTAAKFLSEGTQEPGRHKTMVAAMKSLKDNGVGAEQALAALVHGNSKTVPPLELRELERMVKAEYKVLDTTPET